MNAANATGKDKNNSIVRTTEINRGRAKADNRDKVDSKDKVASKDKVDNNPAGTEVTNLLIDPDPTVLHPGDPEMINVLPRIDQVSFLFSSKPVHFFGHKLHQCFYVGR